MNFTPSETIIIYTIIAALSSMLIFAYIRKPALLLLPAAIIIGGSGWYYTYWQDHAEIYETPYVNESGELVPAKTYEMKIAEKQPVGTIGQH